MDYYGHTPGVPGNNVPGNPPSGQPAVYRPVPGYAPPVTAVPGQVPVPPVPPAAAYYPGYPLPQQLPQPMPVVQPAPAFVPPGYDPRLREASRELNRMSMLTLSQTVLAIVWQFLLMGVMTGMGISIYGSYPAYLWLSAVLVPLSTALPFFIYLMVKRERVPEFLRFEKTGVLKSLLCVLAGLGVCLLANYLSFFVQDAFAPFGYEPASLGTGGQTMFDFGLEFFSTALLVPVMEEFAFRGVIFSSLRRHGTAFAVAGSAIVFSLVHLDFSNVVFALVAGIVFGVLYAKTNNLWITIAIHALNNGLAVVGSYADLLFWESWVEPMDLILFFGPIVLGLAALLLLLVRRRRFFPAAAEETGKEPTAAPSPLEGGETALAIVRAPALWVIVGMMALYTLVLFL